MRTLLGIIFTLLAGQLAAENEWSEAGEITYITIIPDQQRISFKIKEQRHLGDETCSGRFYTIEFLNNPLAKEMYSFLLSHKATKEKVRVYWKNACDSSRNPIISYIETPE